jgi:hypothetical protein
VSISTDEVWGMVTTYAQEIDLEVQFTNVDYNLDNEELCIYTNNSGDENLQVDIWHNSIWNNIFSTLGSGWNNASISTYLDSPTLTIRFNDAEVTGDSVQSTWNIDVVLLSLWDNASKQVTRIEYTGKSNVTDFSRLTLTTDLKCNTSSVDMTIQLYDYEAQEYSAIGEGYLSYTTSSTPGTDEKYSETVYTNPARFVNSTGYWKVRICGSKTTINKTQCNIDLVEFEPLYMLPGETVEYNDWTEHAYKVTGLNGDAVKFGSFSIYHNATSVDLRDSDTLQAISNPDQLLLDVNGEYYFDLRSSNLNDETFSLGCTIGDQNIEKIITQTAP